METNGPRTPLTGHTNRTSQCVSIAERELSLFEVRVEGIPATQKNVVGHMLKFGEGVLVQQHGGSEMRVVS